VEDCDFRFRDDLAARFTKGEPITFQNNKERPIKLAYPQGHMQMYNVDVEGQGKSGHSYFASGILVHNAGAGNRPK